MGKELAGFLEFAADIAREAGRLTLNWFRKNPETELKADLSPVTVADRSAEELLRERITERYPDHGIMGEEFGYQEGAGEWTWLLDPIDGTKSFVLGVPLYAVLVALVRGAYEGSGEAPTEQVSVGAVYTPPLDEMVCAARGLGATWTVGQETVTATVSNRSKLAEARVGTTDFADLRRHQPRVFDRLVESGCMTRTWGDAYGYVLVATGRHEAMIDPRMNPWDVGPLPVIVEEAGGTFTDMGGNAVIGSSAIATNGSLHHEVLGTCGR